MKPLLLPLFPPPLLAPLAAALPGETGAVELGRFPDGDAHVRIDCEVSGREVVIVGDLSDGDAKFLPLVFLARTARELGARTVGLVAPYLPYLRQDQRFHPGEAISGRLFLSLLNGEFDWLVTVEPHLHRIGALDEILTIPATAVAAAPALAGWIQSQVSAPLLVGPDAESARWVEQVAAVAKAPWTVMEKTRLGDRTVEIRAPDLARWRERTPVLVDDIISTGRTLVVAARKLMEAGFPPPAVAVVHGLCVADAWDEIREAGIVQLAACNTVDRAERSIDVAPLVAAAVREHLGGA